MSEYARILIFLISLSLVGIIIYFTRKRKLLIKYSILWIIIGLVISIFSGWIELADKLTSYLGVGHSPSFYFFLAIIFLLIISIHIFVELSRISIQVKNLIQEISLLKQKNNNTSVNEEYIDH